MSSMPTRQEEYQHLWAKLLPSSGRNGSSPAWHPLILHLLDAAAVAEVVLDLEPVETRQAVVAIAGLAGESPPDFGEPIWWGAIYREDLLLLTWLQWRGLAEVVLPDDIDRLVVDVYEYDGEDGKGISVPPELLKRHQKAAAEAKGKTLAHSSLAAMSGIAAPGEFFDQLSEPCVGDEDGYVATRLGGGSLIAIPVRKGSADVDGRVPSPERAQALFLQALPVTRLDVADLLRKRCALAGWERSPLLRHAYPLILDADGVWLEKSSVILDPELGLRYEKDVSGMRTCGRLA